VTALDLESALRNCRAALVAMTEANAAATERADKAEARELEIESAAELRRVLLVDATERATKAAQRATEAEAACAAMRGIADEMRVFARDATFDSRDDARLCESFFVRLNEALCTPIGSGWVSPAEAAELRQNVLDDLALEIGFGEAVWGVSGVHRPENLAESIRDALHERDQEIDRQRAYVDAWDSYFRAAKMSDRVAGQLAAISKARDAWERDTEPEDIAAPAAAHPTEER
jgi:hypothetical protein